MAAPTKTKTWVKYSALISDGDGPTPQAGQSTDRSAARLIMYMIKTQMLAAGWTVVRSCGFYDAGGGSAWHYGPADHWPDADSVRWKEADNKFGWIVLKNTALHNVGNGFQVCFALDATTSLTHRMSMFVSVEGGFSGGDETSYPTATDSVQIYEQSSLAWYSTVSADYPQCPLSLNIWYSTDGHCFRVWGTTKTNENTAYSLHPLMFERLQNPPSWLDKPVIFGSTRWFKSSLLNKDPTDPNGDIIKQLRFSCENIYSNIAMFAVEGISTGDLISHAATQVPDMGGNWLVFPAHVISQGPVPGYLGTLADFWIVPEVLSSGDYFPSDGSQEMVVMGDVLIGNDGTSIIYPT